MSKDQTKKLLDSITPKPPEVELKVTKSDDPYISYQDQLEMDLHADVASGINLIMTPVPQDDKELTESQMDTELMKISAIHHICARLKRRGYSHTRISQYLLQKFGMNVSPIKVKNMIERLLYLHLQLMSKNVAVLRKEIDEQIDDVILSLNQHTQIREDGVMTPGTVMAVLQALDRKVKLWGIGAPEKVELSIAEEIKQAQKDLYTRLKGQTNV